MLGLIVLTAFMIAYGRSVRENLPIHLGIVAVVGSVLTVLTGSYPGYSPFVIFVGNILVLGLFFGLGRLLGSWLDRGKYE